MARLSVPRGLSRSRSLTTENKMKKQKEILMKIDVKNRD